MADTIYKKEDRPIAEKVTALISNMDKSAQERMLIYMQDFEGGVTFAKTLPTGTAVANVKCT